MQNKLKKFETNQTNESLIGLNFLLREDAANNQNFEFGSYYGLIKSLSFVGLYFPHYSKSRFEPFALTSIVLIHLFFIHRIILLILSLGGNQFWSLVIDFLRTLAAILVVHQFLFRQKLLHKCLYQSLPVFESKREQREHRIVENLFKILTTIAWIYILFRILFDIHIILSDDKYLQQFIQLNYRLPHLVPTFPYYVIVLTHISLERVLISGSTIFSILLYILFAITSINHIRLYNHFFKQFYDKRIDLIADHLRQWTHNRLRVNIFVRDIQKLMSITVFFWYGLFCLGFCLKILAFLESRSLRPDWINVCVTAFDLVYINILMICLSIIGSYVWETADKSPSIIHKYISSRESSTECKFKHWAHILVLSQTSPVIKLSANEFFDLSKGLVVSIWISVATYVLILISWMEMLPNQ